jgi:P-type E1-E2 ATPase
MSALMVSWFHYRNQRNLYRLTQTHGSVTVRRDGEWTTVEPQAVVPGDLVQLQSGLAHCDMVLVQGGTCLMDESALTGESYPQTKAPVDPTEADKLLDPRQHKRNVITAGTTVMETEDNLAVVWKTASYTTKGELLRDIMCYKRHSFKFDTEVTFVLAILGLYAVVCFSIVLSLIEASAVYGVRPLYVRAQWVPGFLCSGSVTH